MSEEHPVTLDQLGELMMNLQANLQVVSARVLRLARKMDRLREEIREIRTELLHTRLEEEGLVALDDDRPLAERCGRPEVWRERSSRLAPRTPRR